MKYHVEIDCNGEEASGFEDRYSFVTYGTILAYGNTLNELLDDATVDLINQDGENVNEVSADLDWMQKLIYDEYMRKYVKKNKGIT